MAKSSYRARTGHERLRTVYKNKNSYATARRRGALARLRLRLGVEGLTEQRIAAIHAEIKILESRI